VNEYKMLKHWEKNILPKMLDYCRGGLKQYEIDNFFEQLRIELRKEACEEAAHIAMIICDWKMPGGAQLPSANHDWSSFSIDEIKIGEWAICKIKDDNGNLLSQYFRQK